MDSIREFMSGVLTLPEPSLIPFVIGLLLVPVAVYGIVRLAMRVGVARRGGSKPLRRAA